jgi:hypothetical protein
MPLKRFRADDQSNMNNNEPTITTTEHVYRHGQATPPSPSQPMSRVGFYAKS